MEANSNNTFKDRLDKYWINQMLLLTITLNLTGTGLYHFVCNVV